MNVLIKYEVLKKYENISPPNNKLIKIFTYMMAQSVCT